MSVLLLADTHFTDRKRDAYRMASLPPAIGFALDSFRISDIVIAGDICEEKDRHPASLVNFVAEFVASLARRAVVWVVMGNHDYVNPESSFWKFLGQFPAVKYVDEPRIVRLAGGMPAVLMPHSSAFVDDWKYVQGQLGCKARRPAYFLHQTVEGAASYGHTLAGLNPALFAKTPAVFSGDVHKPQQIGNVRYVGSPYPICFGDDYVGRMLIIDDDEAEGPVIVDEVLVNSPRKIKVEASSLQDLPDDVRAGDMVKVVVSVARSQIASWAELRAGVVAWAEIKQVDLFGVELREKTRVRLTEAAPSNVPILSEASVFSRYCDANSVSADKRQVGEAILKETK
jgi:hypothetical protein